MGKEQKDGARVCFGSPTLAHIYRRDVSNFGPRLGIAIVSRRQGALSAIE